MKNILLTGATGTIGQALFARFQKDGYQVKCLSTNKDALSSSEKYYYWNPDTGEADPEAFKNTDILIHLAGANLSKGRWNAANKKRITDSRVKSASLLFEMFQRSGAFPESVFGISGTDYYRNPANEILVENSANGEHFLAKVCKEWESSILQFQKKNCAVSILRTGPVLSSDSGITKAYLATEFMHIIPTTGSAANRLPWIHLDDLVNLYLYLIENNIHGVFNAVSPGNCSQGEFVRALSKSRKMKWCLYPNVPAFLLRIVLGEKAGIATGSQIVSCDEIQGKGFTFRFKNISDALNNLMHG